MSWLPDDASWLAVTSAVLATFASFSALIGGLAALSAGAANRRRVQWLTAAIPVESSTAHREILANSLHEAQGRLIAAQLYPWWRAIGFTVAIPSLPALAVLSMGRADLATRASVAFSCLVVAAIYVGTNATVQTLARRSRARVDVAAGRSPGPRVPLRVGSMWGGESGGSTQVVADIRAPAAEISLAAMITITMLSATLAPPERFGSPTLFLAVAAISAADAAFTTRRVVQNFAIGTENEWPTSYAVSGLLTLWKFACAVARRMARVAAGSHHRIRRRGH